MEADSLTHNFFPNLHYTLAKGKEEEEIRSVEKLSPSAVSVTVVCGSCVSLVLL